MIPTIEQIMDMLEPSFARKNASHGGPIVSDRLPLTFKEDMLLLLTNAHLDFDGL